ncbi:helix-turn-helix transcriptional regulator [Thauera sp. WH-1]|uniref:helix-turn-helix transcriptional regulator n=1 Tax=Thauera sp. WH-1 TaxID=3398230 RepID=UPI0039FC0208
MLLDQVAAAPALGLMLPLPQEPRLRRVCEALEAEPDSRDGLAAWRARLGCSERTLARLFREHTGLNFRLWRLRLISALPLLEAGERVTDVAIACGNDSVSAFIARFREHFGATPGAFAGGVRMSDAGEGEERNVIVVINRLMDANRGSRSSPAVGNPARTPLVGLSWMTGLRRRTGAPRWLNPARSGRSSIDPDSGHCGGTIC